MFDANEPLRLRESNLYAGGTLVVRTDETQELYANLPTYAPGEGDRFHAALQEGEMLDGLAYTYWKDVVEDAERYWWVLASVNGIDNALDLSAHYGRRLLIPDLIRYKLLAAAE